MNGESREPTTLGAIGNRVSNTVRETARLFRASISKRGVIRTLMLVPRIAWRKVSVYVSDLRFDRQRGVRTRGVIEHPRGDARFVGALPYQPVPPARFRRIIRSLEIRPRDFTFIDIGCGRGRALMLAAEFPFKRIIGVELSETLAHTARENLAAFTSRREDGPPMEVVTCDAASYAFPSDPSVVFFFNPFLEETMKAVVDNLESSLGQEPRELFVVYAKPVYRSALDNADCLEEVEATHDHVVWRSVTHELA